jgi:hypothetical protein
MTSLYLHSLNEPIEAQDDAYNVQVVASKWPRGEAAKHSEGWHDVIWCVTTPEEFGRTSGNK